ncbi:hypothetical protein LOC67_05315 [Stieleria sp. JC731]|uniref:hypothetical protein n=1 Tax=Pirellulaceae TaxID=2691357 RepID=UPI001E2983FF|nr:hypothetical protein [Stieleria sp. JC731]MCC9599972.1 hypothetical protein [Stieleria sp. JC731]
MSQPTNSPRKRSDSGKSHFGDIPDRSIQNERRSILPRSKAGLIAVAASYLFSVTLLAFAFTAPFRRTGNAEAVEAKNVKLEYEARMSSDQYVDFSQTFDQRLKDNMRRKAESEAVEYPDHQQVVENWEKRQKKRQAILSELKHEAEEHGIVKDTIQWKYAEDLEKVNQDGPSKQKH